MTNNATTRRPGGSDNRDLIIGDLVAENMLLREALLLQGVELPTPTTIEQARGRIWTSLLPEGVNSQ